MEGSRSRRLKNIGTDLASASDPDQEHCCKGMLSNVYSGILGYQSLHTRYPPLHESRIRISEFWYIVYYFQLFMVSKTGEAESITSHYLFALGSYRGLYILNWIYRSI
jgi:hypothetical protein